ncbi:hypothetical protein Pmani_035530 [Petrolisthes manimaculis]|uniref:Uncharacterized protein n=1 Tax=Petrolisthes manimaculis TaxID=1843537 RepID=A0AAE1NMS4_9EUCA|nr:hypothetical protein Pmani_035530 [Petrolisthes manimaculis]
MDERGREWVGKDEEGWVGMDERDREWSGKDEGGWEREGWGRRIGRRGVRRRGVGSGMRNQVFIAGQIECYDGQVRGPGTLSTVKSMTISYSSFVRTHTTPIFASVFKMSTGRFEGAA